MMRLDLFGAPELSSFKRAMALDAAELILASRGVLLSDCVEAIAAEARKELPDGHHWSALVDAEEAALAAAFGSREAAEDVVLGIVVYENDFVDGVVPKLIQSGLAVESPRALVGRP